MFKLYYPHKCPITGKSGMNPLRWGKGRWAGKVRTFKTRQEGEEFAATNGWVKALVIPA